MKNAYRDEWITLLLSKKKSDWRISTDGEHIIVFVSTDANLDDLMIEFRTLVGKLKSRIKSQPEKLGFFVGNTKDSRYWQLN